MKLITKTHNSLFEKLPVLGNDKITKIMMNRYYKNSIILNNNEVIDLPEIEGKNNVNNEYSLNLPNKNNIYYYRNDFEDKYYTLDGSFKSLEKNYLEQLKLYQINLSYQNSNTLEVSCYLIEYYNDEVIDIVEFDDNNLIFQPNEKSDAYQLMFKFYGEGFIYSIDVDYHIKQREVISQQKLKFDINDLFLNEHLIDVEENNEGLILNVKPNDKKHTYISYIERNNSYSRAPNIKILDQVDLSTNLLFDIDVLKDETLEFIPMLIEYNKENKIGIKNLNILNPDIINLRPDTTDVRLAFRLSGSGQVKLNNISILSISELPENDRMDFEDRNDVVKLLSPSLKLSEFKVACIMDEFTYNSFSPEVQLYKVDVNKWKSELLFIQPDLVFIESAWVGNNNNWHRKVAYYDDDQHREIREFISYAQSLKIPVIFWNKEDPVHYDRFIETAKLCDYVFTTDEGRVEKYVEDCGHSRVWSLPFAAQPKNHNPIRIQKKRDPRVSFAGSYYRHHEERSKDMDVLLEASKEIGLVIYDRNYEKTKNGEMPNHKFPERFNPYIKGTLPFNLIDKSYKGFKFMINVNTVKQSETMFSRRVFEGLISGTPIISTYSLGMKRMFGDIIDASSEVDELQSHLKNLNENEETYNKYAIRGIREVLKNHTYENRMKEILQKVGYSISPNKTNVFFFCFVNTDEEINRYIKIYNNQSVTNKKLFIIHKNISDYKNFYNKYNTSEIVGMDYEAFTKYINVRQLTGDGYSVVLNKKHYYGENYALDLVLAQEYSSAEIIGKKMYYKIDGNKLLIVNKHSDYIFTEDLEVDRVIIDVKVFDKLSIEKSLEYLQNQVSLNELKPFGAKMFSNDSLNFIENGNDRTEVDRVII